MGSQCIFTSRSVDWWWWGAKRTSLAAKFWIFCRGWMTELGVPMSFVLVIKGSSQLAEKCVALARIGHSATTWYSFLSWWKQKWRKYQKIMGNSSQFHTFFWLELDASLHQWDQPSMLGSVSTFVWLLELTWSLLLQETKLTMLTKFYEKGYLRETFTQATLEFNR